MTAYTVFSVCCPAEQHAGLTLDDAVDRLLSGDGHRWEWDPRRLELRRSQHSACGASGPGRLILLAPDRSFGSRREAGLWVIDQGEWKGMEALSDEDYAAAHGAELVIVVGRGKSRKTDSERDSEIEGRYPGILKALGVISDQEIAARYSIGRSGVRKMRKVRGIAAGLAPGSNQYAERTP